MPKPAFKPLDAITTLVAEAAEPAALGAPEASGGAVSRSRPARPPLKPVVVASKPRPQSVRQPDARAMARPAQNLPEALRSMWTDLKILLASAPARSEFRGDRGGNGGGERSAIDSGRRTGSDSASTPSGSGGGEQPRAVAVAAAAQAAAAAGAAQAAAAAAAAQAAAAAAATQAAAVAAAAQAAAAAGAAQAAAMVVVARAAAAAVPAPVAAMTAAAPAAAATAVAAEVMAAGVAAVIATGTTTAAAGAMIAAAEGMATAAAGGMTEAMTMTTEASAAPESTILRSQAGTGPRRRPDAGRSDRRSVCRPCAGRRRRETG